MGLEHGRTGCLLYAKILLKYLYSWMIFPSTPFKKIKLKNYKKKRKKVYKCLFYWETLSCPCGKKHYPRGKKQWCGSRSTWIRRFLRPWFGIWNPHVLRIRIPDPVCFFCDFYKKEYPLSFPFPLTTATAQNEVVCLWKYDIDL